MNKITPFLFVGIMFLTSRLHASEPFGFGPKPGTTSSFYEATLLQPVSDLSSTYTSTQGLALTGGGERSLGGGHGIRTRLTIGYFPARSLPGLPTETAPHVSLDTFGLNISYRYQFNGARLRPYFWLGPGVRLFTASTPALPAVQEAADNQNPTLNSLRITCSTGPRFALTGGVGIEVNRNWGFNVGYQWCRSMGRNLGTLEFGATYRP